MSASSVGAVLAAGMASVLAAGLGALPAAVVRARSESLLGAANGVAAGVMASVSVGLVVEGAHEGVAAAVLGLAAGVAVILVARRSIPRGLAEEVQLGSPLAGSAALVVAVLAAHSLAEGIAVGAAFAAGESLGVVTAVAIAAHKAAEGFAVGLVLTTRGVRVGRAAGWSMATALPQPLIAVPAFLFAEAFSSVLPLVLGLAAGAMSAVVVFELLPEARRRAPTSTVVLAAGGAFVVTGLLQATLAS